MAKDTSSHKEVSDVEFVKIWQSSESAEEVARKITEKIGRPYSKSVAISRASNYRSSGVHLKQMPRGRKEVNPDKLNKIINAMKGGKRLVLV